MKLGKFARRLGNQNDLTTRSFCDKVFSKFCATGERGIDHEEAQSIKTAERLGLLIQEVQAFLLMLRRWIGQTPLVNSLSCLGVASQPGC